MEVDGWGEGRWTVTSWEGRRKKRVFIYLFDKSRSVGRENVDITTAAEV